MENFADESRSRWIDERLSALNVAPDWEPDVQRSWRRIEERIHRPILSDSWMWRAAILTLMTLFVIPVGLVLAQRGFKSPWPRIVLSGVGVEQRLAAIKQALPVTFAIPAAPLQVSSLAEAVSTIAQTFKDGILPPRLASRTALRDIFQLFREDPFNAFARIPYTVQFPKVDPSSVAVSDRVRARIRVNAAALQD